MMDKITRRCWVVVFKLLKGLMWLALENSNNPPSDPSTKAMLDAISLIEELEDGSIDKQANDSKEIEWLRGKINRAITLAEDIVPGPNRNAVLKELKKEG